MRAIGSLREKYPSREVFWSAFFCIRTESSRNAGEYGPGKNLYLDIYHAVNDTKSYLVLKGIIQIYARYLYENPSDSFIFSDILTVTWKFVLAKNLNVFL